MAPPRAPTAATATAGGASGRATAGHAGRRLAAAGAERSRRHGCALLAAPAQQCVTSRRRKPARNTMHCRTLPMPQPCRSLTLHRQAYHRPTRDRPPRSSKCGQAARVEGSWPSRHQHRPQRRRQHPAESACCTAAPRHGQGQQLAARAACAGDGAQTTTVPGLGRRPPCRSRGSLEKATRTSSSSRETCAGTRHLPLFATAGMGTHGTLRRNRRNQDLQNQRRDGGRHRAISSPSGL